MKLKALGFGIFLSLASCTAHKPLVTEEVLVERNYIEVSGSIDPSSDFPQPEKAAMYPGGGLGVMQHIANTTRYPNKARNAGIEGRVFVSYIVDVDGTVCCAKVVKGAHPELDREALRVIYAMEQWYPAQINGKHVKIRYVQPFNFKL
jgi:Ca-activated chloride channel family protein